MTSPLSEKLKTMTGKDVSIMLKQGIETSGQVADVGEDGLLELTVQMSQKNRKGQPMGPSVDAPRYVPIAEILVVTEIRQAPASSPIEIAHRMPNPRNSTLHKGTRG